MRKIGLHILLAVSLAAGYGCGSAPPETRCFQTVSGIATTVDTAMNMAGDLYRQGKITDAQKGQILLAYERYQHAISAAGHGCVGLQDAKNIDALTKDAQAAVADLIALVESFKKVP